MENKFWKNYQEQAFSFCLLRCQNLPYFVLGLNGESSELTASDASHVSELGGCLWYLSQLTRYLNIDMDSIMEEAQEHHVCVPDFLHLNAIAGQVAEICKKVLRGDREAETVVDKVRACLIEYVKLLLFKASICHVTLEDMATENIKELTYRKKHNIIKGDGDYRGKEAEQLTLSVSVDYSSCRKPLDIH